MSAGFTGLLSQFMGDPSVRAILALIALDFVLGVSSSVALGDFRLAKVGAFLHDDVLGKVVPYFALWAGVHVGGLDVAIGHFDVIEEAAGATVIAMLTASLWSSLAELKLGKQPDA